MRRWRIVVRDRAWQGPLRWTVARRAGRHPVQVDVEHFCSIGQFVKRRNTSLYRPQTAERAGLRKPGCRELRGGGAPFCQALVVSLLEVVIVQPVQFIGVELCCGWRDVVEIEPLAELFDRENFRIAMRPAQTGEIVDDGFGQIAVFVVLHDAHRTVALGELGAVVAEDHRQVRIIRSLAPSALRMLIWRGVLLT